MLECKPAFLTDYFSGTLQQLTLSPSETDFYFFLQIVIYTNPTAAFTVQLYKFTSVFFFREHRKKSTSWSKVCNPRKVMEETAGFQSWGCCSNHHGEYEVFTQ